jgi:hypothetical protein
MAELIASLDKDTLNPKQYGENSHKEYSWNPQQLREHLVQVYFQLVRSRDHSFIETEYKKLLEQIFAEPEKYAHEKQMVYKLIAHVRDLVKGKGEYALSYMMLYHWAVYDFKGAVILFDYFMKSDKNLSEPYGSWKDAKYFGKYCCKYETDTAYDLYYYIIESINKQLIKDNHADNNISLCAKWTPRENSAFGNMYADLAYDYYKYVYNKPVDKQSTKNYAKMIYRNVLTKLNKRLDTTQIKMCNKMWSTIMFDKMTSITLNKQQYAIMFKNKNGKERTIYENNLRDKQDRLLCKENFLKWKQSKTHVNGANVSMYDFVKTGIGLIYHPEDDLIDLLNKQWLSNGSSTANFENIIVMVDTSSSMEQDNYTPLYNAIGLGIRIAEKSKFGKRCLTFHETPSWVMLDNTPEATFYKDLSILRKAPWGGSTNFDDAMGLILEHIMKVKMPVDEVSELKLVVLSDMQFNGNQHNLSQTIDEKIKMNFAEAGMKIHNRPYTPPKIVFWNLRLTSGFPTVSYAENMCMISGYNADLMDNFIETSGNMASFDTFTLLEKTLNSERYNFLKA